MNNIQLIGRLTAKPELRHTNSGKAVCNFSIAVERRFKDADGKPIVDYVDFVAWKHTADFLCKWFDKGTRVAVTGELQTRMYEDKDGKKIKVSEIVANTIEFADGKRDANQSATTAQNNQKQEPDIFDNPLFGGGGFMPIDSSDELPFN